MQNYNTYIKALQEFYSSLAYWRYNKDINNTNIDNNISEVKKCAITLKNELKKLPPNMIRDQVVIHIEKALSL